MKHKYYFPDAEDDRVKWLIKFAAGLDIHGSALGIPTKTIVSTKADADFVTFLVKLYADEKTHFSVMASYKSDIFFGKEAVISDIPSFPIIGAHVAVLPGVFNRAKKLVAEIKVNPALTDLMKKDLGIEGDEIDQSFDNIKPVFKLETKNGHAYLKWKHEGTTAADILADYGDDKGYVNAGRFSGVHYLEPHLPEAGKTAAYSFKIRYVVNDKEVGVWSDPLSISVTGF